MHSTSFDVDPKPYPKGSLANSGDRVQKSVFECRLSPPQLARLQAPMARIVSEKEDSVRYYRLCGSCREGAKALPWEHSPTGHVIV